CWRSSYLVETLEPRRLLSIFLNGIDSENSGNGMWAWDLYRAMNNTGFWPSGTGGVPNYSGFFTFEKNQGMEYIITKAADGNDTFFNTSANTSFQQNFTSAVVSAAHTAGIKILPYFYIYGGSTTHKAGASTSIAG